MNFPDQSHISSVCDALWHHSAGATVMVGSGFSRNARTSRPDAVHLPTWVELAEQLFDRLYRKEKTEKPQFEKAKPTQPSDFLRLAEEYRVAFGSSELNRFLREKVRDDDFIPGEIHSRLMRLPWRDVFTTNWDTLLERTRVLVPERKYGVVRNKDEIPLTAQPRIIKLHGSFPAYFPFVVTEEDYRRYPIDFAPFVNSVQQAMMETIFFLIGFSGDDPNFLHWCGWVRDNLGASAPKVYLAGWLSLPPHRRRMLEERNVVAIDLARHPKAGVWPPNLRHQYAVDWMLYTLERGQPYDVTEWPSSQPRNTPPIPQELQPIVETDSNWPMEEKWEVPASDSTEAKQSVEEILQVWSHNRKIYPGWLVAPS